MPYVCQLCGSEYQRPTEECGHCTGTVIEYENPSPRTATPSEDETPENEYDSSPDVAIDGSLKDDMTDVESTETPRHIDQATGNNVGFFRSLFYSAKAWVKAPFKLVRMYLAAILAFLLVFGLVFVFALGVI